MCEFWYDCIKEKYDNQAKLYYIDLRSFMIYIKTKDFYKSYSKDVKQRLDMSNYEMK